jgi:hypothetical protein
MKTVYDMSSGRMLESGIRADATPQLAIDATLCALQLQLVIPESRPQRPKMPPELVLADLKAFLETMS